MAEQFNIPQQWVEVSNLILSTPPSYVEPYRAVANTVWCMLVLDGPEGMLAWRDREAARANQNNLFEGTVPFAEHLVGQHMHGCSPLYHGFCHQNPTPLPGSWWGSTFTFTCTGTPRTAGLCEDAIGACAFCWGECRPYVRSNNTPLEMCTPLGIAS
jgi:hypothetical protein